MKCRNIHPHPTLKPTRQLHAAHKPWSEAIEDTSTRTYRGLRQAAEWQQSQTKIRIPVYKTPAIQRDARTLSDKGNRFELIDYLRLGDWTERAIREDKNGAIPSDLAPILERIGLNPDAWLMSVKYYNRDYFSVLGAIDRLKDYALMQKKCWQRGQRSYRLVIAL